MARFTLPRDLYHGKGSIAELANLKGKKAIVVVGGGSMKRFGFLDKVEGYLKQAGMEVRLFENVEPDPSVETVMRGAAAMREFEPDWIVAMGGGSPIDAAKAMWAFYEYPEVTFEDLITPFSFPTLRTKAKFCAIPSTSGTATEVTAFAVITDYAKGIKYPLADFNITPDIAIVDPDLAEKMPPKLTAHTANAMYLPKVIKFNARNAEAAGRYAEIARFIDLPGSTTEELVDALIAELRKMNKELNIPYAIQNYGEGGVIAEQSIIDEKEFNEKLSEVAKNAIADACTGSNPRIPTQEEMEKLLTAVYYDKEIDF